MFIDEKMPAILVPKYADEIASDYFKRIFNVSTINPTMWGVDELLEELKQFQKSSVKRERVNL